jgi:hypothetical protein
MDEEPKYRQIAARAIALKAQGLSLRAIGRELGVDYVTARKAVQSGQRPTGSGWQEGDDEATWSGVSDRPVKTLADAVRVAGVDESVWYVDRWEATQWTVVTKDADDSPTQTQQYRVKVYLKRIARRCLQQAQEAVFERMKAHAPVYPRAFAPKRRQAGEYLAVAALFDAHFGKHAWGAETGKDYDLKVAADLFSNAVDDIIAESAHRKVGAWLVPIGNDFYHLDNSRNTTFAGTPLDVDGRYAKVIEAGEVAVIRAVERMLAVAPVEVVWVPGNHDPTTSYHLARMVAAWFRNARGVTVDHGPSPRKYFHWGCNLIGLTHGNEEKPGVLPNLMATERPREWSASTCREWLLGHMHRSRQWQTQGVDTHEGTVVRVVRSLSGTDSWHHRKGFVTTGAAAEVYWYSRTRGYSGHAVAHARTRAS